MTPEIIEQQSNINIHRTHVWSFEKCITQFTKEFLADPNSVHLYDWGTESEPWHAMANWHLIPDLISQLDDLFSKQPELRKNFRGISGCHPDNHVINTPAKHIIDQMTITYMYNYLWFRDCGIMVPRCGSDYPDCANKPHRLFSCMMHHPKPHRMATLKVLSDTGLLDQGCDQDLRFSYQGPNHSPSMISFANSEKAWNYFTDFIIGRGLSDSLDSESYRPPEYLEMLKYARRFFPDNTYQTGPGRENIPEFYSECLFDIVVETNTVRCFFTEKTVRPLLYGKPFVVLGSQGQNSVLTKLGFETFPEYFDLSDDCNIKDYDLLPVVSTSKSMEPVYNHYKKILQGLTDIAQTESPDLAERKQHYDMIRSQCMPKIIHNQSNLVKIMFDDDIIAPECWDIRPRDYTNTANRASNLDVNVRSVARVRRTLRNHPYFKQFVPPELSWIEKYYYNNEETINDAWRR